MMTKRAGLNTLQIGTLDRIGANLCAHALSQGLPAEPLPPVQSHFRWMAALSSEWLGSFVRRADPSPVLG
jgi:hypothetical protein